jgi:hypothetical protein
VVVDVVDTGELVVLVDVLVLLDVDVVVGAVLVPIVTMAESLLSDHVQSSSRTHSVAVYVPVAVYVYVTVGVETVVEPPLPNCHQ